MTRYVNAANETAADAVHASLRLAVELDMPSGFVRAHDGVGTLTLNGTDYTGVGVLGNVQDVTEELENIARSVKLTLSGVDPSLITTATTEAYQGRQATLYLVLLNVDTGLPVANPEIIWQGLMDVMTIAAEDGTASIELTCEDELARDPRYSRYTNEDQQRANAGDKFFERLSKRQGYVNEWGGTKVGGMGGSIPTAPAEHFRPVRPF